MRTQNSYRLIKLIIVLYTTYLGSHFLFLSNKALASNWVDNGDNSYQITGNVGIGTDSPASLLQVVGSISSPGSGTNSEHFGLNSTASAESSVAIGNLSSASGQYGIALGYNSQATGTRSIAVGLGAQATDDYTFAMGYSANASGETGIAIGGFAQAAYRAFGFGYSSNASGDYSFAMGFSAGASGGGGIAIGGFSSAPSGGIAIGYSSTIGSGLTQPIAIGGSSSALGDASTAIGGNATIAAGYTGSIAIGYLSTPTSGHQFVAGSDYGYINELYFGKGVVNSSPVTLTLNGGGASGTNVSGGTLNIAGGKGTGNASGGDINFRTSDSISSGSTLQSLSTKVSIKSNGNVGIGTDSPTSILDIVKDGGYIIVPRKSESSDPDGTNGAIYYNSSVNKFRCFENSEWKDCIGGTGGSGGSGGGSSSIGDNLVISSIDEETGNHFFALTETGWNIVNWFSQLLVFLAAIILFILAFPLGKSLVRRYT